MPTTSRQDLQDHIELAIKVELSTVPPYLFAMYSIEDQSSEAALLIRSIVAEEMLHAALATNLLLAVGGRPRFDTAALIPVYPGMLPHHDPPLELNLVPVSVEAIREVFMRIEQPEVHNAPAEPDVFETLGQFYHALELAIAELADRIDLFADSQADRQLADPSFYAPVAYDAEDSGGLMLVNSVESAREAIEVIVHQGEGLSTERWADPAHQELTHYFKLLQIADGTSPLGAVRPLQPNPRTADLPDRLQPVSNLFNAAYRHLFSLMSDVFGPLEDKATAVGKMYEVMARLMSPLAGFLVGQMVDGDRFAAPTFEIYEFSTDDRGGELAALGAEVAELHPELADVTTVVAAVRA